MIKVRGPLLAAALVCLAGCAGGGEEPTVATAASGTPQPAAEASVGAVARYVESQRQWVRCLRGQGFPDVPDPDARGHVDFSGQDNRRLKADRRWLAAQETCREFSVEVPAELEEKPPPLTAEQLGWRRDYAKCMRANGMPNWPDPGPDGEWPEDALAGELTEQEQAANIRALQICDPVMTGGRPTTPDPRNTGQG